jgi:hypothetical protein
MADWRMAYNLKGLSFDKLKANWFFSLIPSFCKGGVGWILKNAKDEIPDRCRE